MSVAFAVAGASAGFMVFGCAASRSSPSADTAVDPLVAVWDGGRLSRSDFEGWRVTFGAAGGSEGIRNAVFDLTMADEARRSTSEGAVLAGLRLEAVEQSVLVPLLRQHVVSGVEVTPEEVEALRLSNPDAFRRPRKVQLMQVYRRVRAPEYRDQVMAEMLEIRQRILDGRDFESEARAHSESQSRFRGGRLGYVEPAQMAAEVADVVERLRPGQVSRPVEHGGGISIFRCEAIREARQPTPDEVRDKILVNLTRLRARDVWAEHLEDLASRNSVEVTIPPAGLGLRFADHVLGPDDVQAVVALVLPGQAIGDLTASGLTGLLTTWAQRTLAAEQAVELGLDRRADVRSGLRWRRASALASGELDRRVIQHTTEPTEDAVRRAFDRDPQRYFHPPVFDLSVIQVGLFEMTPEERVAAALRMADAVEDGTLSFAEAARNLSQHSSGPSGGRIGWLSRRELARWGPVAVRAIQDLGPGENTQLLSLESGLWMFRLHDARPRRPMAFEDAREVVVADLKERQARVVRSEIVRQHLAGIGLTITAQGD